MMKNKVNEIFFNLKNKTSNFTKDVKNPAKRKVWFNKGSDLLSSILKYVLLYGLAFIILFPLIQQIAVAFREPADIDKPLVLWIPERFSLMNFKISWQVLDYTKSFFNTIFLATGVTLLQLVVTTLVGYSLARLKFPGHKIVFIVVIFTIIVAPTTVELPLTLSLTDFLGTGNNLLGSPR